MEDGGPRMMVWLDGEWKEEGEALVSCADAAFLRGEGVFETMLGIGGRPFEWASHWARLQVGAKLYGLALPSGEEGREVAGELLERNALVSGEERVRLRVTRTPAHLLFSAVVEVIPSEFERVRIGPFVRNERSALAGVKAISYGENSLALRWAKARGATEVLLANTLGEWCEGSWSNLFAVVEGEILTPPLASGCLPGVTRATVMALAQREGFAVREVVQGLSELAKAEEVFLTSSLRGVRPVVDLDGRSLSVGATTVRLSELLCDAERDAGG